MIRHWKTHNYVLISLKKMYGRTCSSIYGNVLKIVTVENDTKFP